jgi:hypothetical protein
MWQDARGTLGLTIHNRTHGMSSDGPGCLLKKPKARADAIQHMLAKRAVVLSPTIAPRGDTMLKDA